MKERTYFITFERQGYTLAIVKVEAQSYLEAQHRALLALHMNDDISEVSEEQAREILQCEDGLYLINGNGDEIDIEGD